MKVCPLVFVCLALISISTAYPATRNVPTPEYPTIQSAIDASSGGDEVVVAAGTYPERINFGGRLITVRSTDPTDPAVVAATVIDGEDDGHVVTFDTGETADAVITGLTIEEGWNGIYCLSGSSPTITNNLIQYNWDGIAGMYNTSPTITGNTIRENGYGVEVRGATITGNTISDNLRGICCYGPALISGNLIRDNDTPEYGGGIYCEFGSPTIVGNVICDNGSFYGGPDSGMGGGIHCWFSSPMIANNVICHNYAYGAGGGICCLENSSPTIVNNTISHNVCVFPGAGIACLLYSAPVVSNCIIAFSEGGGGVAADSASTPSVSYCDAYGNAGGDYLYFTPGGPGLLSLDPLFADPLNEDFHLQSRGGRWTPTGWVVDAAHSPCIDAGDPASDHANEPAPNGGRINLGAYGNTVEASKTSELLLEWLGTGGYSGDGVHPNTGDPNDTFTFKVKYTDSSGDPPLNARCIVAKRIGKEWKLWQNLALTKESGAVETGAVYSCSAPMPNLIYKCRFKFKAADGNWVPGAPNEYKQGPRVVGRPVLCWAGKPGFESDGVYPDSGPLRSKFKYMVLYQDSAGDAPGTHEVVVRRDGVGYKASSMNTYACGSYRLIKYYVKTLWINDPGTYTYRFRFADTSGYATGEPTTWQSGPSIGGSSAGSVTLATALPTPNGAQVCFTLSGPADVTATILNAAGRPIRTVATDKPTEAGAQTLLWDGRADSGLAVPAGLYLIRITARSDDGSQSAAVTTLPVR